MTICLLTVGDSRGRKISDLIEQKLPELKTFQAVVPGANLPKLLKVLKREVAVLKDSYTKIIVLLVGGICSFTDKNQAKIISYSKENKLETAKTDLQKIWDYADNQQIHIVTSTIIPISLAKANRVSLDFGIQQAELDKDLNGINNFILGQTQPGSIINLFKLASKKSTKRRGKYNHKRNKIVKLNKNLLYDGVHPGVQLLKLIQNKVVDHVKLVIDHLNSKN